MTLEDAMVVGTREHEAAVVLRREIGRLRAVQAACEDIRAALHEDKITPRFAAYYRIGVKDALAKIVTALEKQP